MEQQPEKRKTTILLVDDHQIITDGVQTMLSTATDLELIGSSFDGKTALHMVTCLKPDIVITDISMPGMNGIELTQEISRISPETRVLVLTMYTFEDFIYSVIRAGAKGVLSKQDTTREVLVEAVQRVSADEVYFSPSISRIMMNSLVENTRNTSGNEPARVPSLTSREKEILRLYVEGFTNQEIADKLSISNRTVETHKSNIMQKFNFKSTVEMVKYALRNNLVSLD
jgi:two-component system, NarL family, response regulator NreC